MATLGPTLLPSFLSNDADFRTWAQGIHDKLSGLGLVQAGDTGQINIATVTKPTVINTSAGYEVWRFADALQGTTPFFFKVEYGVGASVDRPSLWMTPGAGTNGAGTINAQASGRTQMSSSAADAAGATRNCEASGDSGRAHLIFNQHPTTGTIACGFFVERTKDAAGNATADGVFVVWITGGSFQTVAIPQTVTPPATTTTTPTFGGGLSSVGLNVAVVPFLVYLGRVLYTWLGAMNNVDIAGDVTFQATMFGGVHTFRTVRSSLTPGIFVFLWE